MESEWGRLFDQFSTAEGTFLLLVLVVGFLLGYLVGLFLRQARVRQLSQNMDSEETLIENADLAIADLRGQQATLQGKLAAKEQELKTLRRQLYDSQEEANKFEAEKDKLYNEVYGINAEVEKLNAAEASYAATIDSLNQQILILKAKVEEQAMEPTISEAPSEANPSPQLEREEDQPVKKRLAVVLEQVKALQEENRQLRQNTEAAPEGEAASEHPSTLFDFRPMEPFKPANGTHTNGSSRDDLTMIQGIGPFLQRKLNRMGIRRFEQLSSLDEQGLHDLARKLQVVESRFQQDNWTGQAQRLQQMKANDPDTFHRLASHPSDRSSLQVIEGIGPETQKLLHQSGIKTWDELADTPVEKLKSLLHDSGARFQMHDPSTWPIQATLAVNGHWQLLSEYQGRLQGGRDMV